MKRVLIVGVLFLIVVAVMYRQRLFLRDPLGKVERNGLQVNGANVFINYSNDVLIQNVDAGRPYLVQRGSVPGTPAKLSCLRGMVCWTEADVATVVPLGGAGYRPNVVMTSKEVSFQDGNDDGARVVLR
ncbi:MAG TPA: hypothetical protein VIX42_01200 [Edaphobacter sp.]